MGGLERLPDLFAVAIRSAIILAGLMPDEILMPRSLPRFSCFLLFHEPHRRN